MEQVDVGPVGREVMTAFAQAVASGWVNDEQDVFVNVKVLEALVDGSPHAVAGAIGHLLQGGYLALVEGTFIISDDASTSRWQHWYGPTVKGGEWLVRNGIVPPNLIPAFYPHTCGWQLSDIEHFATDLDQDIFCGDLAVWAKDAFSAGGRGKGAQEAHALAMEKMDG